LRSWLARRTLADIRFTTNEVRYVSVSAWFALAFAGALGLFYVGHGMNRVNDPVWQLPMGSIATAQEVGGVGLFFRTIPGNGGDSQSDVTKVPGGWLVAATDARIGLGNGSGAGLTFLPDPEHKWDGKSLK